MPDIPRVLFDRTVRRKTSRTARIHQGHAVPLVAIRPDLSYPLLGAAVIVEVRHHHIGIAVRQGGGDLREGYAVDAELNCVDCAAQLAVIEIIAVRIIAPCA